jgi:hypothetical protein
MERHGRLAHNAGRRSFFTLPALGRPLPTPNPITDYTTRHNDKPLTTHAKLTIVKPNPFRRRAKLASGHQCISTLSHSALLPTAPGLLNKLEQQNSLAPHHRRTALCSPQVTTGSGPLPLAESEIGFRVDR